MRLKAAALLMTSVLVLDTFGDIPARVYAADEQVADTIAVEENTEKNDVLIEDEESSITTVTNSESIELYQSGSDIVNGDGSNLEMAGRSDTKEMVLYKTTDLDIDDSVDPDYASSVQTADYVTEEMCSASYWHDKSTSSGIGIDEVLLDTNVISAFNKMLTDDPATHREDLENHSDTCNAATLRTALIAETTTAKKVIYADHVSVDPQEYYKSVADQIEATAYTDESREVQYAIAVRRTTVDIIPVSAYIGYSETDTDNEKVNSALNVNEPFIIAQKATVFGDDFYWGYSLNCTGWVSAADLAICDSKGQWIEAWKTEPGQDDFIVVTQNKIVLEPSEYSPELSEVMLTFGTIVKTVPNDKIPAVIDARGPWNNYVVYLPLRDDAGKYVQGIALISQHYEVSVGFLKMTQAEILRVAFNNLGDRYGWGGMQGSMDCSLFTRNIYRCFGLELPRNTSWQKSIPGRVISFEGMSDEDKLNAMKMMPAGTLFFFQGHIMMYIGMDMVEGQEMAYVISDTGSLSDSTGDLSVRKMFSIIINPLTTRRGAGTTWLNNISAAIMPISEEHFEYVSKNVSDNTPYEPDTDKKVPAIEGQTYASSADTLPLETFLQDTGNIYISFSNVDEEGVSGLSATVIKGSKIITKSPVKAVSCPKDCGKAGINKANGLGVVTLNKSCVVSYEMVDGKKYDVQFNVETPKAQSTAVKNKIKDLKNTSEKTAEFDVNTLFGTKLDGGKLEMISGKNTNNTVTDGNTLKLDLGTKDTVKVRYTWLNKKYTMTISVK
jgi:cell wall-associated NlpC family hydrolase